jgi:alpha-1,3/alpha-1,6-mannosyltransferase
VPANVLGRFSILCAILRQLHLVLLIHFACELSALKPDVFFIDQLSACIPLLRLLHPKARILFYCHFPDKLLARGRESFIKRFYRIPFDWMEEWSMAGADEIVVNSHFTKRVFAQTFPGLANSRSDVGVVYPCVNTKAKVDSDVDVDVGVGEKGLWKGKKVILSINRFERKKDVGLAIKAFANLTRSSRPGSRLVVAGGYDARVAENVGYHNELVALAEDLGLRTATTKTIVTALSVSDDIDVLFLLSVPNTLKIMLLNAARLLVYTPANEHFGIVPLEAMLAGVCNRFSFHVNNNLYFADAP